MLVLRLFMRLMWHFLLLMLILVALTGAVLLRIWLVLLSRTVTIPTFTIAILGTIFAWDSAKKQALLDVVFTMKVNSLFLAFGYGVELRKVIYLAMKLHSLICFGRFFRLILQSLVALAKELFLLLRKIFVLL